MTDGIVKNAGKKTVQAAVSVAKQIGQEVGEIPKEAAKQVMGTQVSPIVEEMQQGGTSAPVNPAQLKPQEKVRLDYLEKELQEEVRKNKLAEQQRLEALRAAPPPPSNPPLVEPATRPKRGMLFGIKGKQGTKEVMKPPSG